MKGAGARTVLFAAQGFGAGCIPFAPGTWGSVVGVAWAALVLRHGMTPLALLLTLIGIVVAVPVCGAAERLLGQSDPGCVVLDEVVVMPLVGLPAVWVRPGLAAHCPWWIPVLGFALFRLFDIWKPGPVRLSQNLAGGLGVVMDDVLAALLAGAVLLGVVRFSLGT